MNIDITPKNKIQEFFRTVHDKLEDILFSIILKMPESFIPAPIMKKLESYVNKRAHWQQIHLEEAIEEIHSKQDKKEAP